MLNFLKEKFGVSAIVTALAIVSLLGLAPLSRADEPYARSKDYDLQHSKIALKFDVEQKK